MGLRTLNILSMCLSMAFCGNSSPAQAEDDSKLTDAQYIQLIEQKKYEEAYALVKDLERPNDADFYFWRGVLAASGVLKNAPDRCIAVGDLERSYSMGLNYALPVLNFLYGGNWAAVAALEGHPDAQYLMGKYFLENRNAGTALRIYDKHIAEKKAAYYFNSAAHKGHVKAKEEFLRVIESIDKTEAKFKEIEPIRVFCKPR